MQLLYYTQFIGMYLSVSDRQLLQSTHTISESIEQVQNPFPSTLIIGIFIFVEHTGKLRLMNGTQIQSSAGRLEMYLNGQWGTICDDGFGSEDATLACNQLGYETYQRYGTVGQLG